MPRTWLIVDVSFLCWRAQHTTGFMAHEGKPTGVLFGFFRELRALEARFGVHRFAFAFDGRDTLRKRRFPWYKADRTPSNDAAMAAIRRDIHYQIDLLRSNMLSSIGYSNILVDDEYEGDDMIAQACNAMGDRESGIVVSADSDMQQLLSPSVKIYNPINQSIQDEESFIRQWKITPSRWPNVRAIAGGKDNLPGLPGVAEITAAKFAAGSLKSGDAPVRIRGWIKTQEYKDNLAIARLPYPHAPKVELHDGPEIDTDIYDNIMRSYGMDSLCHERHVRKGIKR